MAQYVRYETMPILPVRIPLEGSIDLTYRCNNTCRHCWLWLAPNAPEQREELTLDEICRIVTEARAMGTRSWNISGGEPMLRPDFPEIFEFITCKAATYSLNTNATLMTPDIAQLLKRKGNKMVALYGATASTYDKVTRNPGGFEQAIRGFNLLKEAGVGFTVQLIPMRDNWHEWQQMQDLAKSLSPSTRVGAPWLFLSACGSKQKNLEITRQRLSPKDVITLDRPDLAFEERMLELNNNAAGNVALEVESECRGVGAADDRLYYTCIMDKQKFAIDPYGGMTFCGFIKDPSLRFDLKKGTFQQAWDDFLPGLVDMVHGGEEWRNNCGDCDNRSDCRSCAAFSYLETGNHFSRVPYLCAVAQESKNFKQDWQEKHRRYFMIGGITVRVESDLDLSEVKFKPEFSPFAVAGPGNDNVTLHHIFGIPDITDKDLGPELYHKAPWSISRKGGTWFYRGIASDPTDPELTRLAVFSADYQHGLIYSPYHFEEIVKKEGWHSLSLLPTDQIWLVELLADRNAVLLHSSAVILNRQGLLFVGHSDAGKSTTTMLLKRASQINPGSLEVEILCDDRNIVRRWPDGWRVHGTWSHGDVPEVSGAEAPVKAILFLRQDNHNELVRLTDRQEIWKGLLATLIKSMVTAQWWQKEMDVLEKIVDEVPCYVMHFDKSGGIVPELEKLVNSSMSVDGK